MSPTHGLDVTIEATTVKTSELTGGLPPPVTHMSTKTKPMTPLNSNTWGGKPSSRPNGHRGRGPQAHRQKPDSLKFSEETRRVCKITKWWRLKCGGNWQWAPRENDAGGKNFNTRTKQLTSNQPELQRVLPATCTKKTKQPCCRQQTARLGRGMDASP